jgi:hypothetical protein
MSVAIYRLLLRLYPAEFRQRWEEEMVEVFILREFERTSLLFG